MFINYSFNRMQRKSSTISLFLLIACFHLSAQHSFINGGFEGTPQDATVPQGWMICEEGTTPDILPGPWGVYNEPSQGSSFIGLITRPDASFESIGQRFASALTEGGCYQVGLDIAQSPTYTGYNQAIKLRIWLGTELCDRRQLLLETNYINSEEWIPHLISFTAEAAHHYIIIEAYAGGKFKLKKGNVLIDNLTPIVSCDKT